MKLKALLTSFLFILCIIGCNAQTSYTEAIERYLSVNGAFESSKMDIKSSLVEITELLVENNKITIPAGKSAESIVDEYMDKRMKNDLIEVFIPFFAETVTIAEINKLSDLYSTPAWQLVNEHLLQLENSSALTADVESLWTQAVYDIIAGKTPRKVIVNASTQRKELFHKFYQSSEIPKMLDAMLKTILKEMDLTPAIKAGILAYSAENLEIVYLNASENFLSDADLKCLINSTSTPEYKKVTKIVSDVFADPQGFGMLVLTKYGEWLEKVKKI